MYRQIHRLFLCIHRFLSQSVKGQAMKTNDKPYTIVIKETTWDSEAKKEKVRYLDIPTTKEAFDDYYRPINAYRKRQQEHGRCACPKSKRLLCNMDCWTCPYHCEGDVSSLNAPAKVQSGADDGNEPDEYIDVLPSDESIEDDYAEVELMRVLHEKLQELDPLCRQICELVMAGETERSSAEILGMAPRTVGYNRKKALDYLRNALKDFL